MSFSRGINLDLDYEATGARLGTTQLTMPVLVQAGEKASRAFLIDQARLVARA